MLPAEPGQAGDQLTRCSRVRQRLAPRRPDFGAAGQAITGGRGGRDAAYREPGRCAAMSSAVMLMGARCSVTSRYRAR